MTRIGLVLALISGLAMSSCGGDEDEAKLLGAWALERGDGCAFAVAFEGDGSFREAVACELTSGDVGVERHEGTYETVGGSTLELRYTASTCPGERFMRRVGYEVKGDQLALDGSNGRLLFERIESDGMGNGVFLNGCWDGDEITFSELRPLE